MPATYEVIPRHRLAITRYSGSVDGDAYVAMVRDMMADERYRPGFDELVLFADDLQPNVSESSIREVVGMFARYHATVDRSLRTAVVLGSLQLELLVGFYNAVSDENPTRVQVVEAFSDVDDALAWLGIHLDDVELPDRSAYHFGREPADRAVTDRLRGQLIASSERERRATNRLGGAAKRYRRLLENLGERFVVFSVEFETGDLVYVSSGFESVFGVPADQAMYRHHEDVIDWVDDGESFPDLIGGEVEGGPPRTRAGRFVHPDGSIRTVEVTHRITRNGRDELVVEGIAEDVTGRKAAEERAAFLATHDALTGLPNRALLGARLELALAQATRLGDRLGVLFLDIDDFKSINDTLGHAAGDAVLRQVADRVASSIRESDTAARVGGDEFVVVVAHQQDRDAIRCAVDKIRAVLAEPYDLDGSLRTVGVSIGIAVHPDDDDDTEGLMRAADDALYRVKAHGKDGIEFAGDLPSEPGRPTT